MSTFSSQFGAHPELGMSLPVLSGELLPPPRSQYVDRRMKDVNKRYDRDVAEADSSRIAFEHEVNSLLKVFDPLMTDYDRELLVPSTCALGHWRPAHTDLEEMGQIAMDSNFSYDADLIDALGAWYKTFDTNRSFHMSLPRGKNIGWPTIISGSNREESDAFLFLHAGLAISAQSKGWKLKDLFDMLTIHHGNPFLIWGSRTQHTDKWMPLILKGGLRWSKNFEPRVRGIFMSPKVTVAYLRQVVKMGSSRILKSPLHEQDRSKISSRIERWFKEGWLVMAIDYSKYERHIGGKRAESILSLCSKISESDAENLSFEFNLPILMFGFRKAFLYPGGRILGSGLSSTSFIGNAGNSLNTHTALGMLMGIKPVLVHKQYQQTWDGMLFGDDSLLAFPPSTVDKLGGKDKLLATLRDSYSKTKMKVDEEPVIKFLGSVYGPGNFKGSISKGYSTWRAVQQIFFPERIKVFPFTTIGYLARLELLGDRGRDFHALMQKYWKLDYYGPPFTYQNRSARLQELVPLAEKQARDISQLDSILQSFYHGVADPDLISGGMFENLLGLSYLTITDPVKQLAELKVPDSLLSNFSKMLKGDMTVYGPLLSDYVRHFNLEYHPGDVLY